MPRIAAPTIDEHVRRQSARVLAAASVLFRRKGFRRTDMSDIAAEVGLARNSLYRYYPNKEHILVACVQRDMEPFVQRIESLEATFADPCARVDAWIDMAIDMATSPAHATLELMSEIREADPELRRQIVLLHRMPNAVLEKAVRGALGRQQRDPVLLTEMIAGMVQSGAAQAIRRSSQATVKRELKSAAARLLAPLTDATRSTTATAMGATT
jgi:AcrR family transcriptional regulator